MALQDYARQVFREVDKTLGKNKHENFMKYYQKLYDKMKTEVNKNDVVCIISNDCSIMGCYRYSICNFSEKKM